MTAAGWYTDASDDALARWHDGTSWTRHTLVKADWAGPGAPPPPGDGPTAWVPADPPGAETRLGPPRPLPGGERSGVVDRYRGLPRWARVAAPVGVVVIALAVATSGADEGGERAVTTDTSTTLGSDSIQDAAARAQAALGGVVDDGSLRSLIASLCYAGVGSAADDAAAIATDPVRLIEVIEAAGDGAEGHCPEVVGGRPGLLNDVYVAALAVARPTTTTPPTTAAPPTTTAPVATTRAPVARSSPSTSPQPSSPSTTQAPSTYYKNCDAARAAGAAPVHRGDPGYGPHLDRDNDGIGCE